MGLLSYLKKMKKDSTDKKVLVLGLDNSGKTTILKSISEENIKNIKPTEGFNMKNLAVEGVSLCVWDLGGQKVLREYWSNYFDNTSALIYVVDSADEKRLQESGEELKKLLEEPKLKNVPFLIFANKQDISIALPPDEIAETLNLDKIENRKWMIVACSATTKEGLPEGLDWIIDSLHN